MEIYGMKIGERNIERPLIFYMENFTEKITINFYMWIIKKESEIYLIDTGFTYEEGQKRGVQNYKSPSSQLQKLGVDASKVKKVIITHFHWDHFNGYESFPNATFYVQKNELDFVKESVPTQPAITKIYNDISSQIEKLIAENRFYVIEGEYLLDEFIQLKHVGGHTPGLQTVRVTRDEKPPIHFIGDNVYYRRNLSEKIPPMLNLDIPQTLRIYTQLENEKDVIIPGHDPEIINEFKQVHEDIFKII
jgi:glyoxylase-like metal-dependent hydrolase (beta-lactamase superfamily II)